jgi:hypothetical protein
MGRKSAVRLLGGRAGSSGPPIGGRLSHDSPAQLVWPRPGAWSTGYSHGERGWSVAGMTQIAETSYRRPALGEPC